MTTNDTALTWLEEWIFYMEFVCGRTRTRWEDFEKDWKINSKSLRALLHKKLDVELEARKRWPMYASVAEDLKFRNEEKWAQHFPCNDRIRIFMRDNTNVPLMAP